MASGRIAAAFVFLNAGSMSKQSSAALAGSLAPVRAANVAMRSTRSRSCRFVEPAGTWPGHLTTNGTRCPPSQASLLKPFRAEAGS